MKRISDALELLTAQHDELVALLAQIPPLTGERRGLALGELADKLTTHLAAEQELFYPALGGEVTTPPADEWRAEHERLTEAVGELLGLDAASPAVAPLFASLSALFADHVRAQEDGLFVTVAEAVPAAELTALGTELDEWSERARCIAA